MSNTALSLLKFNHVINSHKHAVKRAALICKHMQRYIYVYWVNSGNIPLKEFPQLIITESCLEYLECLPLKRKIKAL